MAVTIHLSGNMDDVVQFLEDNGGDPRNVGEDYIEAYVPVALLGQLSEQPGVTRVRGDRPAGAVLWRIRQPSRSDPSLAGLERCRITAARASRLG